MNSGGPTLVSYAGKPLDFERSQELAATPEKSDPYLYFGGQFSRKAGVLKPIPKPPVTSAESELQSLSYQVSHDLGASLRHMTGFSELLLAEMGDGGTPRLRSHARHVRKAGDTCLAMLEQLLVYTRAQTKVPVREATDATLLMRAAVLQLRPEAESALAEISLEPLGEVYADAYQLAIVFHHLLENAIKFRRSAPPRIKVRPDHDENFWRLRITDNGLGVGLAFREKAFDMFRRLNSEDAFPGVGAGLAIARRIARLHGGEISFCDGDDVGASVLLVLPRNPSAHAMQAN